MFRLLALMVGLASVSLAEEPLPELPRVYSNESSLGLVLGHDLTEVGYVAAHCEAADRYLRQILFLPALPSPRARIEILDPDDTARVTVRNYGGEVFVQVQLGKSFDPSVIAAEVATRTWLGRVALAGGKPIDVAPLWLRKALIAETRVILRPALAEGWYREARREAPVNLKKILAGEASDAETFIFWRVLRADLGSTSEQARALVGVAHGVDLNQCFQGSKVLSEGGWQMARTNLLLARAPISLGLRESAEALDDIAHFVFDLGQGDVILTGEEMTAHRNVDGIKQAVEMRLAALRREILRQNPVYHNAWRTLGAWLENFPSASAEDLNKQWSEFLKERVAADALSREVESTLAAPSATPKN